NFVTPNLQSLGMSRTHEFSVCWCGEVQAQFSEPYTFYIKSDDGARVWLNEQLIIDQWRTRKEDETASAPVSLVRGQKYLLRIEYFQNQQRADVHFSWSSPSTAEQIVPQSQLYSQPTDSD